MNKMCLNVPLFGGKSRAARWCISESLPNLDTVVESHLLPSAYSSPCLFLQTLPLAPEFDAKSLV